jgi:hypothetical protein
MGERLGVAADLERVFVVVDAARGVDRDDQFDIDG